MLWSFDVMLLPPVKARSGGGSASSNSGGDTWPDDDPTLGVYEQQGPLSPRVAAMRAEILEVLLGWASLYHEEVGDLEPPPGVLGLHRGSLLALITYLKDAESWLMSCEAAGDYFTEVRELARKARRTAAPGKREGLIITEHNSDSCPGGDVWAKARFSENAVTGTARCATCQLSANVEWWEKEFPPPLLGLPLTDAGIVEYVLVRYGLRYDLSTIRTWRQRGKAVEPPVMQPLQHRWNGLIVTARETVDSYIAGVLAQGLTA